MSTGTNTSASTSTSTSISPNSKVHCWVSHLAAKGSSTPPGSARSRGAHRWGAPHVGRGQGWHERASSIVAGESSLASSLWGGSGLKPRWARSQCTPSREDAPAMAIPALPTVHSSGRTRRYWCRPKWRGWLRINQRRFSQSSIGASLQDGRLLTRVEEDLRAGRLGVSELCPLNVVHFRGRWFSRDNRRLHVLLRVLRPERPRAVWQR